MRIIYLRTNTINKKKYVGQTNNFKRRNWEWLSLKQYYANKLLTIDREKYGLDNWVVEILKECEDSEADYWEQYYIKKYNTKYPNGYNMSDGGKAPYGVIRSEETRKKMSEARKGQRAWNKGKYHTEESKKKMSEAQKGLKKNKPSKIVYQYTLDGKLVKIWTTTKYSKNYGFHRGNINECCNGKRKTHKGFIWSYFQL